MSKKHISSMRKRTTQKSICILLILAMLSGFQPFIQIVHASNTFTIDVFTQKEPYDGKGSNQPCDVFAPRETVFLYALVSNNSMPVENQEVIFDVYGPANPSNNNTFSLTALTNASGIAVTSFVLPFAPQCFGVWNVYARANVSGTEVQDLTWFTVYWTVEILWIETGKLNSYWIKESVFAKGELVDVKVVLRNIAWIEEKNVTIRATIYDSLKVPVASSDRQFIMPANSTETVYIEDLLIPKWAFSCNGNAVVAALTPEEGAHCPQKNQTTKILPCYYVGGTNVSVNKDSISSWTLTTTSLIALIIIANTAKKRWFKNSKSRNNDQKS